MEDVIPSIAISIRQPWASLIIEARKDIENRTWKRDFRGPCLIHAAGTEDEESAEIAFDLVEERRISIPVNWMMDGDGSPKDWRHWLEDCPRGGIIGVVDIVACVPHHRSKWFMGPYGFVMQNPRPLPFFQCKGALGFFRCEYGAQVLKPDSPQMELF